MTDLPHTAIASTTPYVWSLVLSFGTLLISIILIYIARFQAKLEIKDLSALRTMFDRYPAWGKRANWAQENSFEAFTIHAPAALLVHGLPASTAKHFPRSRFMRQWHIQYFAWHTSAPIYSTFHSPDP